MIQDGRYTLVYAGGEYRTVSIENVVEGDFKGKSILSRKAGQRYQGIAFLDANNRVMLWRRYRAEFDPKRAEALQKAVDRIAKNPKEAGMAYAIQEGRCCRCGRELTVPASIHAGMGPDCAQKYAWEKADQVAVHDVLAATRVAGSTFAESQTSLVFPATQFSSKPMYPNLTKNSNVQMTGTDWTPAVKEQAQNRNDRGQVSRMVGFQKTYETQKFYDPFGVDEKLTEEAAVAFWTKRFTANPIDDDRFWGDEAGRAEAAQERVAFASDSDYRELSAILSRNVKGRQ